MNEQENWKRKVPEVELEQMQKKKDNLCKLSEARASLQIDFRKTPKPKMTLLYAKANSTRKTTEVEIPAVGQKIFNFVSSEFSGIFVKNPVQT